MTGAAQRQEEELISALTRRDVEGSRMLALIVDKQARQLEAEHPVLASLARAAAIQAWILSEDWLAAESKLGFAFVPEEAPR